MIKPFGRVSGTRVGQADRSLDGQTQTNAPARSRYSPYLHPGPARHDATYAVSWPANIHAAPPLVPFHSCSHFHHRAYSTRLRYCLHRLPRHSAVNALPAIIGPRGAIKRRSSPPHHSFFLINKRPAGCVSSTTNALFATGIVRLGRGRCVVDHMLE